MSYTMEQLRATSDADLVRGHDEAAQHTVVGVNYFLDELRRRDVARAVRSSQ